MKVFIQVLQAISVISIFYNTYRFLSYNYNHCYNVTKREFLTITKYATYTLMGVVMYYLLDYYALIY